MKVLDVVGRLKAYSGPTGVYYRKIRSAGHLEGSVSMVIEFFDMRDSYTLLHYAELKDLILPTEELEKRVLTKDNRKDILLF